MHVATIFVNANELLWLIRFVVVIVMYVLFSLKRCLFLTMKEPSDSMKTDIHA